MVNLVDSALEFWLTSGRYTDQFEAELAELPGRQILFPCKLRFLRKPDRIYGADFPTCWESAGCSRGDEIITVAAGFPTTVTPAIQYGAVPVFVDVTIPQYNIDADKAGGGAFMRRRKRS